MAGPPVALEDEVFGEVPVTAVVCSEPVSETGLAAHARTRLEPRKVPKRFVALEEIPRGDAGKPSLAKLRELLAQSAERKSGPEAAGCEIEGEIRNVASDVFRVEPGALSDRTGPGDIPGWDSFSQLNFVLAVEARFRITIPASRIAAIRSIGDMVRTVGEISD